MAKWNFWNAQTEFFKTKLVYNSAKISRTERNVYLDWYFEASKHYRKPKIASLQMSLL